MVQAAITGLSLLIVLAWVVGLIDLVRNRHTMEGWQVVLWALVIIFIPFIGLIVYLFWRLGRSDAMRDALSAPRDDPDPGEQPTAGRM